MNRHYVLALGAVVLFTLTAVGSVEAAEVSRAEYRESAEPICKLDTQANERILGGVRSEVRRGKLGPAAVKFRHAAAALKKAEGQLQALPQPAADQARLAKWFGYIGQEIRYFEAAAVKLKAGKKGAAETDVSRISMTANLANSAVLAFEFDYCRLEPSRFT